MPSFIAQYILKLSFNTCKNNITVFKKFQTKNAIKKLNITNEFIISFSFSLKSNNKEVVYLTF